MKTIDRKVLDAAYESGCRFWDTADIYGDNEILIGKWYVLLRHTSDFEADPTTSRFKRTGKRNDIFLATKFGITPNGPNGTPEYARKSIQRSLDRLGIDHVDLYYLHRQVMIWYIWLSRSYSSRYCKTGRQDAD